ncbi:Pih1 domain-containing protein 3, partial [Globisporangium splendens]
MGGAADILALSELISGHQEAYDECTYEEQRQLAQLTPSTVGGAANAPEGERGGRKMALARPIGQIKPVDPRAIWNLDEVPSDDEDDDAYGTRSRPNNADPPLCSLSLSLVSSRSFEILYKQNVMAEDVFLNLSDKDLSSAHCEAMVVRIECPNHRQDDIEPDVKKQKLLLQSSSLYNRADNCVFLLLYPRKLSLYLPHPVRHQDGHAKWDPKKQTLTISLPIIRGEW